jgi:flavin-binding protein dodecin
MGRLSIGREVKAVTRVFPFGDSAARMRSARAYDDQIEVRAGCSCLSTRRRADMAKKGRKADNGVYRVTEIIGTSTVSWEDAASSAIEAAAKSLRDLRVAEVSKLDMKVEDGKVVAYRARVSLSFKYEA